ncbi:MAG: cytochrome c3 family protein [Thermodesulfobacteriota bacterium]|nr:cytochrome c3 family protein [Thermodesulfobacteriota bacterium]
MRKRTVVLYIGMAVLVSILTFMLMPVYSQEDIVSLQNSAFKDRQRPAAVFPHDQHNEKAEIKECNVCHHVYEGGNKLQDESSEGQACSDCHNVKEVYPTRRLMKAYHDLCKGCHQENKKGPITCGECHRK